MPENKTVVTADPDKQEFFITREFDAPRELVFRAHTDPEIYVQWLGPHGMTMKIEEWDCRDGGAYRFTHERGGHTYAFFGVNHEVTAPVRIVGTFEFSGLPERGHVIMSKLFFEELPNDRCRLVSQNVFFSVADRDGMIQSGMESGVRDGYEKLDALLISMNSTAQTA